MAKIAEKRLSVSMRIVLKPNITHASLSDEVWQFSIQKILEVVAILQGTHIVDAMEELVVEASVLHEQATKAEVIYSKEGDLLIV